MINPTKHSDVPETPVVIPDCDCERREFMVPMRDGIKLKTVLVIPKGAVAAPMVLDRTPYGAVQKTRQSSSVSAAMAMYVIFGELLEAGYILVMQDIRGKHQSEGDYVLNRPIRGPLNPATTDHATDAHDTVAWLAANVPESNGRVGLIGVSYDGFTALMGLLEPHEALKCVVPINPMVDNWIGDDWFQNGAFRQMVAAQYVFVQSGSKGSEVPWPHFRYDEFETWLEAGNAATFGSRIGMDRLPAWVRMLEHPAYDEYWQSQALDRILSQQPLQVPTLHVHSQWDAEDIYGSMAVHAAFERKQPDSDGNRLVIGPWSHPGVGIDDGSALGALRFGSSTALTFRHRMLRAFLDAHLRNDAPGHGLARVTAFETGTNTWLEHETWPPPGGDTVSWYLREHGALAESPATGQTGVAHDDYVSDPAKPVPYQLRPIRPKSSPAARWHEWLVDDQRFTDGRPDVLTYRSPVFTAPLHIAGQPVVRLFASTTGTDSDWVVKLIDVYPDNVVSEPAMGGYQLPLAMTITRGRYRNDPSRPTAIPSGEILPYTIQLPHISHAVLPGHRLMLQVQSSWFPLYDRNPQTFVPNIFFAPPEAYVPARQSIHRSTQHASRIELPVRRT